MTTAAIAALMDGDALAAVKDLDGARRCSKIDLLANEGMGDGIKEAFELDVIIGRGPDAIRRIRSFTREASERSTFDTFKYLPPGNTQSTHEVIVDAIKCQ
ncbi:hypothetical protein HFO69_32980 [Rhizobium laguerreae]|uniref:hypothetical protein n=1 Tax=Rhizobium laguerreae TaxID=1076926 RepID=UPI001C929C20|nr:hypothetical protein [Rhizobium laguerreae]MBY3102455.1 hypothetical protein [Rhizobium laguerreae]